jgi:hypothetical protein
MRCHTTILMILVVCFICHLLCMTHAHCLFIFSVHHPAQSAARQLVQLVSNSGARLSRSFTIVETLQYEVDYQAPEKEATSCATSEEECRDQEDKSDADGDEGIDKGSGDGEEETCC